MEGAQIFGYCNLIIPILGFNLVPLFLFQARVLSFRQKLAVFLTSCFKWKMRRDPAFVDGFSYVWFSRTSGFSLQYAASEIQDTTTCTIKTASSCWLINSKTQTLGMINHDYHSILAGISSRGINSPRDRKPTIG